MRFILAAVIAVTPSLALAHPGHDGGGFGLGLAHPVLGPDHLLAMLAVGLWAALSGGRALWAAPAAFLGAMLIAGLAGFGGAEIALVEHVILASIILLGLAAAFLARLPLALSLGMIAVFGFAHGFAHGIEGTGQPGYVAGFMLATAALHVLGAGAGRLALRHAPAVARIAGGAIALAGAALATA